MAIKKIIILFLLTCGVFIIADFASAGAISSGVQSFGGQVFGGSSSQSLPILAALIIKSLLGLLGIVAVAMILYAGFLYLTSTGKEEQIKRAKSILVTSVIGLIIIFSAYAIANFVFEAISNAVGQAGGGGGGAGGGETPTPGETPGQPGGGVEP